MSIREVKELPFPCNYKGFKVKTDRQNIEEDIRDAIEQHIETFEFLGDYNFKYLSQKVKEVAHRFFWSELYYDTAKKVVETLKKEFPDEKYLSARDWTFYKDDFIQVKNFKGEDRIHVYAYLNYKNMDNFYNVLLRDTREFYERKRENK